MTYICYIREVDWNKNCKSIVVSIVSQKLIEIIIIIITFLKLFNSDLFSFNSFVRNFEMFLIGRIIENILRASCSYGKYAAKSVRA